MVEAVESAGGFSNVQSFALLDVLKTDCKRESD
jgi:hypothetical protein